MRNKVGTCAGLRISERSTAPTAIVPSGRVATKAAGGRARSDGSVITRKAANGTRCSAAIRAATWDSISTATAPVLSCSERLALALASGASEPGDVAEAKCHAGTARHRPARIAPWLHQRLRPVMMAHIAGVFRNDVAGDDAGARPEMRRKAARNAETDDATASPPQRHFNGSLQLKLAATANNGYPRTRGDARLERKSRHRNEVRLKKAIQVIPHPDGHTLPSPTAAPSPRPRHLKHRR